MELKTLKVKPRELSTKGHVNQIRRNGGIPAVYYGNGMEPVNFEVSAVDFRLAWGPGNRNSLLNLEVEGSTAQNPAIVYDVQKDPITGAVKHIDFKVVKADEKVEANIPVRLVGTAYGVKSEGGQLFQTNKRVRVAALPEQLPAYIEVDVTPIRSEEIFYAKQLVLENCELVSSPKAVVFYIQKGRKK